MVEPIARSKFESEVMPILEKIFAGEDAFSPAPFTKGIPVKKILFDWRYKYSVGSPLIQCLIEAAKYVGDSGFYLRGRVSELDDVAAWYVPFSEIESYLDYANSPLAAATSFEQTLLSPSGKWGILTSHETHMLLGCTQQFFDKFKELVPGLENQVNQFLQHWKHINDTGGSSSTQWLPGLINQVYGREMAVRLLRSANIA